MKISKDPLFIGAALLLCFPLGLFLVIMAEWKKKYKIIISLCAALIIFAMIFLILNPTHKELPHYQLSVTNDRLYVGQSASIFVAEKDVHYADIDITAENDCLSINGTVLTAKKKGKCLVTAKFGNQIQSIPIQIVSDHGMGTTVFASPGGKRYHDSKTHGGKNAIAMSREDAEKSGKSPCKICY